MTRTEYLQILLANNTLSSNDTGSYNYQYLNLYTKVHFLNKLYKTNPKDMVLKRHLQIKVNHMKAAKKRITSVLTLSLHL